MRLSLLVRPIFRLLGGLQSRYSKAYTAGDGMRLEKGAQLTRVLWCSNTKATITLDLTARSLHFRARNRFNKNSMSPKNPKSLRSYRWYGPDDLRSFGHRSRAASMGCIQADYSGKPVIAVINTWSDINPCHSHLRERANDVKRGVWQAGGFPI